MSRNARGEGSIYRRKDGRWEGAAFVTTSSGRRRRVRIYGRTRSEVHTKLVARLRQEQQGIVSPDRTWRLGDFLDYWLPIVKDTRRPTTYTSYEMIIRLYLKPVLGHYPLSRLTVAIVQQAFTERLAEGRSVRTVQKMRTVLSAALTRAQREELVVRNVAHHVELPTWHRKTITPWTLEQARTFLTAARSHRWQPAFLLLVVYGMRRSEVLGLRWQDIDFDRRVIHVRNQILRHDGDWHLGPVKTNAGERDLPLVPLISGALRSLYEPGARPDKLVFQTQFGTPVDGGNLLRAFARISEQAGLPRITLHHLRHTAATFLKNLGLPARDTQLILGHAHISTTQQLYQHADVAGQTTALSKLQSAIVVESDGSDCRQELPSNTENGPEMGPSTLSFSLVAPTGLEPVTQGSSVRATHPFECRFPGVNTLLNDIGRKGLLGRVAVRTAVK